MESVLKFTKLKRGNIFNEKFENLTENNEIVFPKDKIAVVYAPNGTGKTTLARILRGDDDCSITFEYGDSAENDTKKTFYVISNQIERHIIQGNTDEYILGENIAKEREKKADYEKAYLAVFSNIQNLLKNEFKISKQSAHFFDLVTNQELQELIKQIAKKGSKISSVDINNFVQILSSLRKEDTIDFDSNKLNFVISDFANAKKDSFIEKIKGIIPSSVKKSEQIRIIEKNETAIPILQRYINSTTCIVCDTNGINPQDLIESKKAKQEDIINNLDEKTKQIVQTLLTNLPENPFNIEEILLNLIETQDATPFTELINEFRKYESFILSELNNKLVDIFSGNELLSLFNEYQKIFNDKIELTEEDEILIQDIIANSIGKEIKLVRDEEKNIVIKINNTNLLDSELSSLELSTGESNFISLSFELLKAKRVENPIIVIDDPISSFDSIYKNKIAYCLLKILEKKTKIVLTHNLDLVRLLDVQMTHCFSLYLLSNDIDSVCGFVNVMPEERDLILYFDKLLDKLRSSEIEAEITNKKEYILSLIPFMRAVIKIINPKEQKEYKDKLTGVMHGYSTEEININPIYNLIFSKSEIGDLTISTSDILNLDIEKLNFFKSERNPLLSKTLKHTLTYLFLRLSVEKCLCDKFPTESKKKELLGDIINSTLKTNKLMRYRVALSSKKTLLNEFNHYEGNFNLFQPAIDITDSSLEKEKKDILQIIKEINKF